MFCCNGDSDGDFMLRRCSTELRLEPQFDGIRGSVRAQIDTNACLEPMHALNAMKLVWRDIS